ncbi:unnamed protein product, partial [Ectocarpus sp. 12 AP-2014]
PNITIPPQTTVSTTKTVDRYNTTTTKTGPRAVTGASKRVPRCLPATSSSCAQTTARACLQKFLPAPNYIYRCPHGTRKDDDQLLVHRSLGRRNPGISLSPGVGGMRGQRSKGYGMRLHSYTSPPARTPVAALLPLQTPANTVARRHCQTPVVLRYKDQTLALCKASKLEG